MNMKSEEFKLPEGWKWVKLGEVGNIVTGSTPPTENTNYYGDKYPFISPDDIENSKYIYQTKKKLSEEGFKIQRKILPRSICVVCIGSTIGKVAMTTTVCSTNQQINTIIPDYKICIPEALYYLVCFYIRNPLQIEAGLQVVPIVNKSKFSQIKIPLPPLPEQQKIAEILETVDNTIEKTEKIIEKYKRIKQGLMQELLTKGIDENWQIRSEETHKFKEDSPLGRIPEEWEIMRLGEVIEIYDKLRIPLDSEYRTTIKGDIPYCGATGVIDYINDYIFNGEYVLIAEDGGRFNRFEESVYIMRGKFWANNHVHVVKGREKVLENLFLKYYIDYEDISYYISGSTREKLNQQLLKNILIPLLPLPEQQRIAEVLSQIDEVIEKEENYKRKLESLKRGLMESLLTGKVRVNKLL